MTLNVDRDWNQRYLSGDLPWDSGVPSRELQLVLSEHAVAPGRSLELGCGTGTNAIWLAGQGFDVTAVDCSEEAISQARRKADAAQVSVNWIIADVQRFGAGLAPFDFLFDRGCYHCCRRVDLAGYLETHRNVTRPGTLFLCLCGSIHETGDSGIPKVSEEELRREFAELYDVVALREFHFDDGDGAVGPLGWSCVMRRR
jgi:SAM-dependent methyltransferase